MAPEILFGEAQSKKTDIWSLGVLLYELFHNKVPFRGEGVKAIVKQMTKKKIYFRKFLNPLVKNLILKLLKFDQQKRPGIDTVLRDELISYYLQME